MQICGWKARSDHQFLAIAKNDEQHKIKDERASEALLEVWTSTNQDARDNYWEFCETSL